MDKYKDYRQRLLTLREEVLGRVNKIDRDVHHLDQPVSADFAEQAVERENEDVLSALGEAARLELKEINAALLRMEEEEYEYCSECGDDITWERLNILPFTSQCVKCAARAD